MHLELDVTGHGSLPQALAAYFTAEVLEGSNMWQLDDGSKVCAQKGLAPAILPTLLTLALKR